MKIPSPSVNRTVFKFLLVAALGFACCCRTVSAAAITLTATDASNTSSFNAAGNWSDGLAPSAANDYVVSSGFALRTPITSYVSYIFQGKSLTLNGNAVLAWKLALGAPTITVNDLRLDNGIFSNSNNNYTATLNGNVTLSAGGGTFDTPSADRAMVVNALVSGTGNLTVKSSATAGGNTTLTNANNSYTGNTVISTGAIMNIGSAGRLGNGTYAGTIANSGAFVYKSSANQVLSGSISGTGTLTQSGAGTLTLNNTNSYNGTTTVSAGTLLVSGGGLTATAGLTVATTSVLELGASNVLNNTATMTLSGGTFRTGGFSDTIGALTLSNSTVSSLDFGSGTSVLLFSGITADAGTLNITNWTLGSDSLRFTSNTNLLASRFTVNGGAAAILDNHSVTGYYEVVPEPATWALLAFSLTTVMVMRRRRRD